MRLRLVLSGIMIFIASACDSSGEDYSPEKWLVGFWKVTSVVSDYRSCDYGNGPGTQYNEYNPDDEGYWHYLFNADGSWSYTWNSFIGLTEGTGTWHLTDGWLSIEFSSGSVDVWRIDFESQSLLHWSADANCTDGGSIYHSRRLERID